MSALLRSPQLRGGLLIAFAVLAVAFTMLFAAYGQAEPCRALAVERARTAKGGAALEHWTRMQTSQMSTGACIGGLLDSWGERLTHYVG
jgi:hypothetical protein